MVQYVQIIRADPGSPALPHKSNAIFAKEAVFTPPTLSVPNRRSGIALCTHFHFTFASAVFLL